MGVESGDSEDDLFSKDPPEFDPYMESPEYEVDDSEDWEENASEEVALADSDDDDEDDDEDDDDDDDDEDVAVSSSDNDEPGMKLQGVFTGGFSDDESDETKVADYPMHDESF